MDHIPTHTGRVLQITISLLTCFKLAIPTRPIKQSFWIQNVTQVVVDGGGHLAEQFNTWVWVWNGKRVEKSSADSMKSDLQR